MGALCPTSRIFAIDQGMLDAAVNHQDGNRLAIHRHVTHRLVSAIQQQSVSRAGERHRKLIHDATRHASIFMLGLLTKQGLHG